MCATCGCGQTEASHEHPHVHGHAHVHEPGGTRLIRLEQDILGENRRYAEQNRRYFERSGIFALNLVSSPGAGKTALLEATIRALKERTRIAVIEGDQQTRRDADRILSAGARSLQINTGKVCHLDAHMVGHAVADLGVERDSLLFIENVGNLVCPSAFDLGEAHKVVVLSVTEGDDKPIKYPDMFHAADVMVLNKIDLLPYVDFDAGRAIDYARQVNPDLRVIQLSATRGDHLPEWLAWLEAGWRSRRREAPSIGPQTDLLRVFSTP